MGRTMSSLCRLWVLAQEVAVFYFGSDKRPVYEKIPLAFAEAKYQKLLAWADTIAEGMIQREHSAGHVLIFQSVIARREGTVSVC
jgi:hypothetical protein